MRVETTTRTLYHYDELPTDKAKEKARDWFRTDYPDYDWWDYDDAKQIGAFMGLTDMEIQFTGFWSQGDGASFTARYTFEPNACDMVKDYAPQDSTLHAIAAEFDRLQSLYGNTLSAKVTRSNAMNYVHQYMMDVDDCEVFPDDDKESYISAEDENALRDNCRAFAGWIYRQLESQYDYLVSDEAVEESIRSNEYEFTEEGKRA